MNIFESIGMRKPQKSSFNLTHNRKFSFSPGKLYPTLCREVLPGDRWSFDASALVRFQPMISPVMHMVDVCSYSFFVPDRLTMNRGAFEVFITGGPKGDGKDALGRTIEIPHAYFHVGASTESELSDIYLADGTLSDYLGIGQVAPVGTNLIKLNMMPFISFWRIWCEYFRDQNLHPDYVALFPAIFDSWGDITSQIYAALLHPDNPFAFFGIPNVCWEKDYFTSALPFAQRGQPVETPLSGTGTVTYKQPATARVVGPDPGAPAGDIKAAAFVTGDDATLYNVDTQPIAIENVDEVALTSGGFTINSLRLAARLQEWLEKMARGGARYIEQIKSQFGVTSSDARLQRPEFLGGGKMPVHISEVLQTSENGATPLAEMAGHAVAAGKQHGWSKFFEEHGKVYSFIFLRPKTSYQQGIDRMWTSRFDKLDWAWPSFAHLGEQEVLESEIYATYTTAFNEVVFGYQQRYAEYKYIPSTVHGEFRNTLDHWHWGRQFATTPTLSPEFVSCDPSARIFNVIQDTDPLYCIVTNRINAVRPLPYQGEPTL